MQENEKSKTADYTEEYPKFTPEMKDAISWASAAIAWRC